MPLTPLRFIGDEIEVNFDQPPLYEKMPDCPASFTWRGTSYSVAELLNEWHDFERRGRMGRNMRPAHLRAAQQRGSWGVGRYYFRVRTHTEQIFDLYYDRAPKDVDHRKGAWFLYRELSETR